MKKPILILVFLSSLLFSEPIRVYFGPKAANDIHGPFYQVKGFIQAAKHSLLLCIHEFEMIEIAELLNQKAEEGVKVTLLLEEQWVKHPENTAAYKIMQEGKAKVVLDTRNSGLMHNKYIIRDDEYLLTGSMNFTLTGFFRNFNDIIVIKSTELAKQFKKNYLKLINPGFSIQKRYPNKWVKLESGEKIRAYFSREGYDTAEIFTREIAAAKKKIHFFAFVFSSYPISKALEEQIRKKKVSIRGVFDDSFESENLLKRWNYVPFQRLWEAGADVKYDGEKAKLHHKQMLLDDHRIITGSYNFSKNAAKNNNENFVLIDSRRLNAIYQKRFENLWERFPARTSFEQFVQSRRKDPEIGTYRDYQWKVGKTAYFDKKKVASKSELVGVVREVMEGDLFKLEVNSREHRHFYEVKLYGVIAPVGGHNAQEPQASYARQFLNKWIAQKKIRLKVMDRNDSKKTLHGLVYIQGKDRKWIKTSINEMMLEEGFVCLDDHYDYNTIYKRKIKAAFERLFVNAEKLKKYIHQKKNQLKKTPSEFTQKKEKEALDLAETEVHHSLSEYRRHCYIGNRKSKKYYRFGSSKYMEYMKDLTDEKLIFFLNEENAKLAGYIPGGYP